MQDTSAPRFHYIIDQKLYDLTSFIPSHPGGQDICYFASHDVSNHYKMLHGRSFDHEKMAKYLVKDSNFVPSPENMENTTAISPFGQEINARVNALFKNKQETYADYRYYIKAAFILTLTLIFEYLHLRTTSIMVDVVLGTLYALIALNVSHDATHGALGNFKWYHEIFKWSTDWIGSSKVLWLQQHVLSHHAYTNHHDQDADITSCEPFVVFHPSSKRLNRWHAFQHLFYLFVIKLYAFSSVFNIVGVWKMQHFDKFHPSDYAMKARNITLTIRIFVILRLWFLPMLFNPHCTLLIALVKGSVVLLFEGLILAFLFLISHNYEDSTKVEFTGDWHKDQIISSSSYGGRIAGFITGGLNYQIEHHLFPRINYVHYPKIHPIIREVCEKHGVRYTYYNDVVENFTSTLLHIRDIGNSKIQDLQKKEE